LVTAIAVWQAWRNQTVVVGKGDDWMSVVRAPSGVSTTRGWLAVHDGDTAGLSSH